MQGHWICLLVTPTGRSYSSSLLSVSTHFRSGNLNEYQKIIERIALLFICWKRRHYNKSTLAMLQDLKYYKQHLPELYNSIRQWLRLYTEKKVEIFHSLLRDDIENHFKANLIQKRTRALGAARFLETSGTTLCHNTAMEMVEKTSLWLRQKIAEFLL